MSRNLLDSSKTALLDLIKRAGEVSIDEMVERLELAKTTIRQHLILLEDQGLIVRQFRRTGRGRPQLVYRLSAEGERMYPSQDGLLLRGLLDHLMQSGQTTVVRAFFEQYWEQRRQHFEELLRKREENGPADRLEILQEMLRDEGFMPDISRDASGGIQIRECNCPFPEAVKVTTLPCMLEAGFIQAALSRSPSRVSYMPHGEPSCTYEFEVEGEQEPSEETPVTGGGSSLP